MTLAAGTRLGPYEIGPSLGAGGMGEVYRARDTRLDRDVAIKVLPSSIAQNPQFKLRFEREAKTISQLNHPHICTLHDIGVEGGVSYLVMELVGGESLADVISRGPLPPDGVLKYGAQIAEALAAAHRAGVVHRDLKPANVMITKSGAKLLDFGLAKSNVIEISVDDATQHKPLTQEGTILGTFQYMAPEQLEGQDADARTDIFALGALLHEMATGKRAFDGKTKTSLIAAIVKEQPVPIAALQPLTPAALQHVVDRCLAKDPDGRWQNALDVASELRWIGGAGSQSGIAATAVPVRPRRSRLLYTLAAAGWLLTAAAAIFATMAWARARAAVRVTRLEIAASLDVNSNQPLAVSPDGRRVATITPGAITHLAVRDLGTGETRQLAGTEGATYPFWAADGQSIGFFVTGLMKGIDLQTGAVQTICDATDGRGGTWGSAGVIVFAPDYGSALYKVSENGGRPEAVTKIDGTRYSHRNPMFLPDGKHFLYNDVPAQSVVRNSSVRIGSIDGGPDTKLLPYASNLSYADGWLFSTRDRNLVAQAFDAESMTLEGKPVSMAQNIDWYLGRFLGTFGAGGESLVYRSALAPKRQLLVLDPGGTPRVVGEAAEYALPVLSPDGRRIIVNRGDNAAGGSDLWMLDSEGGNPVRLTFTTVGTMDDTALFAPDGQRVVLVSNDEKGFIRPWIQPVSGGAREMLRPDSEQDFCLAADFSPDGRTLVMVAQRASRGWDIEKIDLDGDRKWVPMLHGAASEGAPRISPNGRWMAYQGDESGQMEVYVTDFPAGNAKWQVSKGGGTTPAWSADGRMLYFLSGRRIVGAAVHEGGSFSTDSPRPLDGFGEDITGFTVGRSGRMIVVREIDAGAPPLTVILNWRKLLEK